MAESTGRQLLILTRAIGEELKVGEDVHVHLLRIVGNSVTIGIEAPASVPVHREEIYERKVARAIAASMPPMPPKPARNVEVKVVRRRHRRAPRATIEE